ncbi:MAG: fluoride efflux transporter CrcB [Hyphomicrobiales bacterium]|nr:fluoride efflux transporter CrcB [Hyphomicrobiales bacterium]
MKLIALAALGGGIGSALRYALAIGITKIAPASFPWAILTINVVGCFAMGVLFAALAFKLNESSEARVFLATGVLGGFTTFSAFSLDFMTLMQRKDFDLAIFYVAASVGVSLLAIYAGAALGRALWA